MLSVKEFVLSLDSDYRGVCPSCGKRDTFTVTHFPGEIRYNCFSNSCDTRGVIKTRLSWDNIEEQLRTSPKKIEEPYDTSSFIPAYTIPQALKYLEDNNCLYAVNNHLVSSYYDSVQNRVVFSTGGVTIGRSLNKYVVPKWYRYDSTTGVFLLHSVPDKTKTLVLVEDPASACAVSTVYSSLALLGTELHPQHTVVCKNYNKLVVALDKDATVKATEILKDLTLIHKCVIILPLEKDLKHYSPTEIEGFVNGR